MEKIVKPPSNASIRRALTTLKKAGLITGEPLILDFHTRLTVMVDNELLAPKKTRKVRLKTKKVVATGTLLSKPCCSTTPTNPYPGHSWD